MSYHYHCLTLVAKKVNVRSLAFACSQQGRRELTCLRARSRRPPPFPAVGALDDFLVEGDLELVEGDLEEAPLEGALDEPLPFPSSRWTNFLERRLHETTALTMRPKALEPVGNDLPEHGHVASDAWLLCPRPWAPLKRLMVTWMSGWWMELWMRWTGPLTSQPFRWLCPCL